MLYVTIDGKVVSLADAQSTGLINVDTDYLFRKLEDHNKSLLGLVENGLNIGLWSYKNKLVSTDYVLSMDRGKISHKVIRDLANIKNIRVEDIYDPIRRKITVKRIVVRLLDKLDSLTISEQEIQAIQSIFSSSTFRTCKFNLLKSKENV